MSLEHRPMHGRVLHSTSSSKELVLGSVVKEVLDENAREFLDSPSFSVRSPAEVRNAAVAPKLTPKDLIEFRLRSQDID